MFLSMKHNSKPIYTQLFKHMLSYINMYFK